MGAHMTMDPAVAISRQETSIGGPVAKILNASILDPARHPPSNRAKRRRLSHALPFNRE
jgi:hypothetical protein